MDCDYALTHKVARSKDLEYNFPNNYPLQNAALVDTWEDYSVSLSKYVTDKAREKADEHL